ncbi:phosphatase PAP2 family protein [Mucilaginibacter auburnensis]|uniref:Undecaprenyl-diphosphatase n=1 Tax=Mucilaginibacter auburnensis TaxID=1457233 RepID=A0A2H9VU22_9SPHI|nr:phosphatase PAP2 family protein [Mucilaginibacter auburnensis]PJJ84330.1 undecaprenyl-diphosphatase [Mucilaginibacter auburnensis]
MPDFLLNIDQQLFHFINHDMSNWFFDWLMPVLRNRLVWIPLYVFIFVFCLWRYKKQGVIILALLLLTFGLADFGSASIIKPYFNRLRPCNTPELDTTIIERVDCGTGYSFPSSHASDHFAIAVFLSIVFYKRHKWVLPVSLFWAASISFAQVYVGVHYPVDVTAGAIYGILAGLLFGWIFWKWQRHLFN